MIYEIVNPSDPYTLEAPDHATACLTAILIGEGYYGLRQVVSGPDVEPIAMPVFLIGGAARVLAWLHDQVGVTEATLPAAFEARRPAIVAALQSVLIGSPKDRAIYDAAVADMSGPQRAEFRATWDAQKRSSMNDIGQRAQTLAVQVTKLFGEQPAEVTP